MGDSDSKRVVVTDQAFGNTTHERSVAAEHGAEFREYSCTSEEETAAAVAGADVVFVNFAPITARTLAAMRPGAVVIRYGVGYDNVDVEAADRLGVRVAHVPDYGVETVADHTAAGVLALARRLPHYDRRIRRNGWVGPTELGLMPGFRSMTVGLIGLGRIAQGVVRRLRPFGFSFVASDPYCTEDVFAETGADPVDLDRLAARSHVVCVHAPHTAETHKVVDAKFLAQMPDGAILVNTARGQLVDEDAVAAAMRSGKLVGVALDVFDPEPLAAASPLRAMDGVLLTPHAAFFDCDSLDSLQLLASEEAGRALRGEPLRCPVV